MSFLRTNPNATLIDLFRVHPDFARPLHEFAHRLLRGPSPLSEGERELLAAYVSALNRCEFCRAAHTAVAVRFGMPEGLVNQLVQNFDRAALPANLKALFGYVRKLNDTPDQISRADVEAVYQAGWDETALTQVALICGYFNLMNRWVDGMGIQARPEIVQMAAEMLHRQGYAAVVSMLSRVLPASGGASG